jgi:hypothetical protein
MKLTQRASGWICWILGGLMAGYVSAVLIARYALMTYQDVYFWHAGKDSRIEVLVNYATVGRFSDHDWYDAIVAVAAPITQLERRRAERTHPVTPFVARCFALAQSKVGGDSLMATVSATALERARGSISLECLISTAQPGLTTIVVPMDELR